jgi:hypothetical protein
MVWRQQRVTARLLASPVAKGRDRCSRVRFQPRRASHQLCPRNGRGAPPGGRPGSYHRPFSHNRDSDGYWLRQFASSRVDIPYGLQECITSVISVAPGLAMRQRLTRSAPPAVFHIAGVQNTMADVASRAVKGVATPFHLLEKSPSAMCPQTFLTLFNSTYPLPQTLPWTNVQPPSALWSKVILTLLGQRLPLRQLMITLEPSSGKICTTTPESVASTPGCATIPNPSNKPISCPFRPGSLWNLRQCGPSWTPNCGKSAPSHGINPPSGRVR